MGLSIMIQQYYALVRTYSTAMHCLYREKITLEYFLVGGGGGGLYAVQSCCIIIITYTSFSSQYSLMWNLTPDKRGAFKAARTNFLFILLMLVALFIILLPIGYIIAKSAKY